VAFNDTSYRDHDEAGGFCAGKPIRSTNTMADEVRSAVPLAEKIVRFALDEPASGVLVLRVAGEMDLLTMPLLEHHLHSHLDGDHGHVVVDLSGVTFLGVVGLTSLVAAHKTATGRGVQLYLTGTGHRAVARLLEITKLDTTLNIAPTVGSVVDALGDSREWVSPGAGHDA
jgi:anti-sigma B factor antagonist